MPWRACRVPLPAQVGFAAVVPFAGIASSARNKKGAAIWAAPWLPQQCQRSTLVILMALPAGFGMLFTGTAAGAGLVIGGRTTLTALTPFVAFLVVLTVMLFVLPALTTGLTSLLAASARLIIFTIFVSPVIRRRSARIAFAVGHIAMLVRTRICRPATAFLIGALRALPAFVAALTSLIVVTCCHFKLLQKMAQLSCCA